jgi:ABC-2 type transport system ATP-binding protein
MLALSGVTHIYANGTKAIDNATLTIPTGMFGLLGPNGAGKSTLMRCIATLQTPSAGSIVFGDIDVTKEPERLRALCLSTACPRCWLWAPAFLPSPPRPGR